MKGILANMWDNKESVVGGLFDMFNQTGMKKGVDNRVQGLIDMGVPEALFTKAPATTEANLGRSTANAIRNLPAQVPDLAKGIIDIAYNPIDTAKEIGNLAEGVNTNLGDLFYDTLTPKKYEAAFKEFRDRGRTEQSFENEANASAIGQSIYEGAITEQGRRDFAQGNSLDLLIGGGYAATKIPKLAAMNQNLANPISAGLSTKDVSNDNPFFDSAGTFSKAEQTVQNMKQGSMGTNEVIPYLQGRGILNAEIQDLKLDRYVEDAKGKTVTKQGLLDHINDNRTVLTSTSLTPSGAPNGTSLSDTIFISDPQEAYTHYDNGFLVDEETPDGTMSVLRNEDYTADFEEDLYMDLSASHQVQVGDNYLNTNTIIEPGDARIQERYPFNYQRIMPLMSEIHNDEHYNSLKKNQKTQVQKDLGNSLVVKMMHELNPEKYPLTTGMELFDLVQDKMYQRYDTGGVISQESRAYLDKTDNEITSKLVLLGDNNMEGIREWDQIMLENSFLDDVDDNFGEYQTDVDAAVKELAEREYLNDPVFEQKIPVEVEGETLHYTVTGNNFQDYMVYDTEGVLIGDTIDLPRAQNIINNNAVERSFLDDPGVNAKSDGNSKFERYLPTEDLKYSDTYSEELIGLVANTNKKSKYSEAAVFGGEGYEYTEGHWGEHPNTLVSVRKTIKGGSRNPGTVIGGKGDNPEIYDIGEMQSDWLQEARQFGYTPEETKLKGVEIKDQEKAYGKATNNIRMFDEGFNDDNDLALSILYDIPNHMLKQGILAERYRIEYETLRKDNNQDLFSQRQKVIQKELDWNNNILNPESDNFDAESLYQLESGSSGKVNSMDSLYNYFNDMETDFSEKLMLWESHTASPRNPLKENAEWLNLGLQHAISKAIQGGQRHVSWSTGEQVLNKWNPLSSMTKGSRNRNTKGNVKYEELYKNVYDRVIPKAARKFLQKYGGGELQTMIIDGTEKFVIEITDEMIENMRKELPNLPKDSKVIPLPQYGKANQITGGLLQTDIAQPELQGLIA